MSCDFRKDLGNSPYTFDKSNSVEGDVVVKWYKLFLIAWMPRSNRERLRLRLIMPYGPIWHVQAKV